jgi:hypothetical protein
MLDVFCNSGYPVSSHVERGTVTVRFPLELTETARAAVAGREATRRMPPEGAV